MGGTVMKRLLLLVLALLILAGCQEKPLLSKQDNLHESVLNYYQLSNPVFKSDNLEAKVELVKVETEENIYYRYLIVFVPLYVENMQFKYAQIEYLDQQLQDYIDSLVPLEGGYDQMNMLLSKQTNIDWPIYKEIEDFRATLWATYLTLPKKEIAEGKYSIEQIDNMMANFELVIGFNKFKDTIKVENLAMIVVDEVDQYNRGDIETMRKDTSPLMYFTSYTFENEIDILIELSD